MTTSTIPAPNSRLQKLQINFPFEITQVGETMVECKLAEPVAVFSDEFYSLAEAFGVPPVDCDELADKAFSGLVKQSIKTRVVM